MIKLIVYTFIIYTMHELTPHLQKNPWSDLPKPLVYLAPMSGITNQAYRQMIKRFTSDLLFPEFVSIDAMYYGASNDQARTWEMLRYNETERPIIAQVFGSDPELFHTAALKIKELGFDGIDINFGCPAPKVAKNGGGCALLGDLGLSHAIIEAVIDAVGNTLPVSVKTRVSYKKIHVRDFCRTIADLPLSNICVHGRSFEKPYEGAADLDCMKEVKTLVPFLVTASGHGHTPEATKHTLDYTGADGIAVARGTFGKPWLIQQIKDYLQTGAYTEPSQSEILDSMIEHVRLAEKFRTDAITRLTALDNETDQKPARSFVEIRKVLGWYVRDIPHATSYRNRLVRVNTVAEIEKIVTEIKTQLES